VAGGADPLPELGGRATGPDGDCHRHHSSRRLAEEQASSQTERAQTASRLITMGEMASSVAHELNQPLTAINNYCNGMVSRIKAQQITEEDLLGALEKTAKQAQRAGQIIHRIRSFVKRSEPNRTTV
jgi:C4-dicarboxylate-specific signal transduction histidine kinase